MDYELVMQLLSAGVIAALVTGIFSLVIAIKNNKRLLELETVKQNFAVTQDRYKSLKEAYDVLLRELPQESLIGHYLMNIQPSEETKETDLGDAYQKAEQNIKIIHGHFRRYGHLLSDVEQDGFNAAIKKLDEISMDIIQERSHLADAEDDSDEDVSIILRYILDRLMGTVELEEKYFQMYQENLSKMSKTDIRNKK